MWTWLSISAFVWGQAKSKLGGVDTYILHHAFISIFIAIWAVTTHYVKICLFSLILQGLHEEGWYVHFASCFYINIYCIMGCYYTLYHNTYAFSLLFYKVYMKRENAGSWNSGLEKEQILETYSAQLQKSWNSTKVSFGIY